MRRTITLVLACLAVLYLAGRVSAKEGKTTPLTGTWQCVAHGGSQGDISFTLDLEQNGEAVSGSVSSSLGDTDITSASFKNDNLEIKIDTADSEYLLHATYREGELSGTWSSSGSHEKGTWQGKQARHSNP